MQKNSIIEIYWDGDKKYYRGTIIRFDETKTQIRVCYDDGEWTWENLGAIRYRIISSEAITTKEFIDPEDRIKYCIGGSSSSGGQGMPITDTTDQALEEQIRAAEEEAAAAEERVKAARRHAEELHEVKRQRAVDADILAASATLEQVMRTNADLLAQWLDLNKRLEESRATHIRACQTVKTRTGVSDETQLAAYADSHPTQFPNTFSATMTTYKQLKSQVKQKELEKAKTVPTPTLSKPSKPT